MGASVSAYWPGIKDNERGMHGGFYNDDKAFGNWMAERESHPDVLAIMKRLGVAALLSYMTDGMEEDDVDWVSPDELIKAAQTLRELVLAQDPRVKRILETYALSANGVRPVHEEFAQDLADVQTIAKSCKDIGVTKMTLDVNW
jgi:hypothetical protein